MSKIKLELRRANLEDHQGILDITKDEYLWGGLDYIPHVLKNWLQEAAQETSNRDNIVFTLDNQIVGFESFYFQNCGELVVRFGFRVRKDLRGKGYGREMIGMQLDYLKENHPKCQYTVSAMPDIDMPDEAFTAEKFGERLQKSVTILVHLNLNEYKIPEEMKNPPTKLVQLEKEQYRKLLQDGRLMKLCDNGCLCMNWVSVLPLTEDDIQFAVRKDTTVMVDDAENPTNFSIFTKPIPVPLGYKTAIDVYAKNRDELMNQVNQQIWNLFSIETPKISPDTSRLSLQIYVPMDMKEAVHECLRMFKLYDKLHLYKGKFDRQNVHMYIYKDKLYK